MFVKISNLKMPIDAPLPEVLEAAEGLLHIQRSELRSMKLLRRSVDARHGSVQFVYTILAETTAEVLCDGKKLISITPTAMEEPECGKKALAHRPVIVGFGPCGMFCALWLARRGYRPLVLERGADVDARTAAVNAFWKTGTLNETTNVQFGEGGAGTFSDGKLTTRIGDASLEAILQEFVRHGAPEDILYNAMPHIGTDVLKSVVKNIRKEILSLGGEIQFQAAVSDLVLKNGEITSVRLAGSGEIPCGPLVAAIGHSARDTYEMLFSHGIAMVQKPFSVGFRAEHLREDIDRAMYGKFAGHPLLGAAPYKLSYREGDRGCYSFCMCPGGSVVNASSEQGRLVTNGMSERARDRKNSNSAICVSVSGADFGTDHPLSGIAFQRKLEEAAFVAGGKNFCAPVQLLGDYLSGRCSARFEHVRPSFLPGTRFYDLNLLLPKQINDFMKAGMLRFERKIRGFTSPGAVLTGIETRTSAPVRILRNENLESVSVRGLFPAGEGAGYAGGIMSAAADGVRIAHQIMKTYQPF